MNKNIIDSVTLSPDSLRQLVGRRVGFQDHVWCVVDVMEDRMELVLESCDGGRSMQSDQYGDAHRRVRQRIAVPVLDGEAPAPEFLSLELLGD